MNAQRNTGGRPRHQGGSERYTTSIGRNARRFLTQGLPYGESGRYLTNLVLKQPRVQRWLAENPDVVEAHIPDKDAFTIHEVALLVGKDPTTVRRWCNSGRVPYTILNVGKRKIFYISRSDTENLREQIGQHT